MRGERGGGIKIGISSGGKGRVKKILKKLHVPRSFAGPNIEGVETDPKRVQLRGKGLPGKTEGRPTVDTT